MRTIKFRAISTHSGQFVYGNFIHSKRFKGCGNEFRIHQSDSGIESDVIPETVGQFTTLQGVGKIDAYEGDILEDGGVIIWSDERLGFFVREEGFEDTPLYDIPFFTIIGNIHENTQS